MLPQNSIAISRTSDDDVTSFMRILCDEIISGGEADAVMERTSARFQNRSINRWAARLITLMENGTCFPLFVCRGAGAAAQGH